MMDIPIKHPWIIMHEPEGPGGPIQCLLAGPPNAGWKEFGLCVADLIRHIANGFRRRGVSVDEFEILSFIERQIEHPTSPITGGPTT